MKLSVLLPCLLALVTASSVVAAERTYDVTGIVRDRRPDGRVVIQHEDIPGYMPAMTMAFALSQPDEASALHIGDRVRFRLRVDDAGATAGSFMVTGPATLPPAAASASPGRVPRLREGDAVPDFALVTENGQPFAAAALQGKATVITFIFTRCPVPEYCPAMAARFGQLQRVILADAKLAARTRLLSITLDPEFDRPETLKAYGQAVGANPAVWSFCTGSNEAIARLAQAFAVYRERNGNTLEHTLCTALIGSDGRVVEIWRGNGWRGEEIVAALRREATEAAVAPCCP